MCCGSEAQRIVSLGIVRKGDDQPHHAPFTLTEINYDSHQLGDRVGPTEFMDMLVKKL
jgi:hypothetical protein